MKIKTHSEITEVTATQTVFEELLTVEEVCDLLKVRPNWISQRIHRNALPFPHVKVGTFSRFPSSGVRKFLDEQISQHVRDQVER